MTWPQGRSRLGIRKLLGAISSPKSGQAPGQGTDTGESPSLELFNGGIWKHSQWAWWGRVGVDLEILEIFYSLNDSMEL